MPESQSKPATSPSPKRVLPDDPLLKQFLETQHQKAKNEAEQIQLQAKELDNNKELSAKYLEVQARLEADRPNQTRMTMTRIGYISAGLLVIILAFIGLCLHLDKEQFVIDFIKYSLYPLLTGAGYLAGRKSNPRKSSNEDIENAQVIDP